MGREAPGQRGPPAAASQPANGTLMARAATFVILCRVFCLVELRGLEPLTPCVQSNPGGIVTSAALRAGPHQRCPGVPESPPMFAAIVTQLVTRSP